MAFFELNFCDSLGNKKRLTIQKVGFDGGVTKITGGGSPIIITYKNEEDDKFNPVTTSSAVINLMASEAINLDTFYTEDEKQWRVLLVDDTEQGIIYNWTGFLIPDFSNEPFLSYPYEFSLKASDLLGTLKDIPYTDGEKLIKKTASIKTVIAECLAKTDLGIPLLTGVNTYFNTDDATADVDPLTTVFIDTTRFIDTNNQAFSCFDVLKHLALQFTANIKQSGGRWTFIDISEYRYNSFISRIDGNNVSLDTLIELDPEQIANKDHNIEKVPAYGSVNSYYQYGFLSNKLLNGDFDVFDEVNNVFANWTQVGASTWSVMGQKKENITLPPPIGQFFTGNRQMTYKNAKETIVPGTSNWRELDMDKYIYSDPIAVTFSSLISFSVEVSGLISPSNKIPIMFRLSAPGETDKYWNGDAKVWQESPTIVITHIGAGSGPKTTVSVEAQYPPHDGLLEIRLYGLSNEYPGGYFLAIEGTFDNATLNVSENKFYKSGIGMVSVATNRSGSFSKTPDPIVLLFGDDPNKNRTSWMRDSEGNPTTTWFKVPETGPWSDAMPLQAHVSTTVLYHHHKPTRRFEGSFRGSFSPIDSFSIPLTDGRFIFLSGDIDVKSAISRLVLAEILTNTFEYFDERSFEDTGSFKDSSGNTVGSPTGVNIPPMSGGGGVPLSQIETLIGETLTETDLFIKNQTGLQTGAKFNISGGRFEDYLTVPLLPSAVAGSVYMGNSGSSGVPPIPSEGGSGMSYLADLLDVTLSSPANGQVLMRSGSSWVNSAIPDQTWAQITGKPTTLSGYGITDAYPLTGNPSGFLTGINSGMVTGALGYTPSSVADLGNYLPKSGGELTGHLTGTSSVFQSIGIGVNPLGVFQAKTATDKHIAFLEAVDGVSISAFNDAVSANVSLNYDASIHRFKINGIEKAVIDNNYLSALKIKATTELIIPTTPSTTPGAIYMA